MSTDLLTESGAIFDPARRYRYWLWRDWSASGGKGSVGFVMLNPSMAAETTDDPTIRRCVGYAKAWGYARLEVGNLFGWRATDPVALPRRVEDAVGPDNDRVLSELAARSDLVVAAWGVPRTKDHAIRASQVETILDEVCEPRALALTSAGHPKHPLYLPAALVPRRLSELRAALVRSQVATS